jgi:hypothetical protein
MGGAETRSRPTITSGSGGNKRMSTADFSLNSVGTLFGIAGPAIPARPDPICGIAHTKIFFLLRERIDEDVSPGGVAPLLAPKTKQVNISAGAPATPGVGGGSVTKETVGLPSD